MKNLLPMRDLGIGSDKSSTGSVLCNLENEP